MSTILVTGATDGIGRLAARHLAAAGHDLLLHGRSRSKLTELEKEVRDVAGAGRVTTHRADLSSLTKTADLAEQVLEDLDDSPLHALVNNAGVYSSDDPVTADGLDVRFVVNALAPYLLTRRLDAALPPSSRVVNVASGAQGTVDLAALRGERRLADGAAYAQSKLALTMWSCHVAAEDGSPLVVAVNPSSLMATKMVADAFGITGGDGNDPGIGADILVRAAVGDDFAGADGAWYDGDTGRFAEPHADAQDAELRSRLVATLDELLSDHLPA